MSAQPWWQCGAIYQLLVPSFLDTDNDGLGDLAGITARLDYLEWLGVNAIWLSPCYPSPLKELGYDVSDYCNIEPRFGSLAAFDRLLEEAHERDLRVILDWVGNHTSAQHPWFRESRSSRSHARRNWYLWRDAGPDGSPPNNWVSVFGGSVWQWDAETSQYYLHTFLESQPDLNWREPAVRAAMLDAHEVLARSRGRRLSPRCGAAVLQRYRSGGTIRSIPTTSAATFPIARCCPCTRAINRASTSCSRSCARSSIATPATASCSASSTCRSRSSSASTARARPSCICR